MRPKGVVDGKQINISVLFLLCDGGTEKGRSASSWCLVKVCRWFLLANPFEHYTEVRRRAKGVTQKAK